MKKIFRLLTIIVLTAFILCCTACGKIETGMKIAYDNISELCEQSKFKENLSCRYFESDDMLTIGIQDATDLDKLFKVLNKSVKGAQLGTLMFESKGGLDLSENFVQQFGLKLSEISCESIKCLGLSETFYKDDAWTAVLSKTKSLYEPAFSSFIEYTNAGRDNLQTIKKIIIGANNKNYDFANIEVLDSVEEIIFAAGLNQETRDETLELCNKAEGETAFSGLRKLEELGKLNNLNRVLFYPELSEIIPNKNYCYGILSLQLFSPEVNTNVPGREWTGDESTLVSVRDINVLDYADDLSVLDNWHINKAIASAYNIKARQLYEAGESFSYTDAYPSLKGKCFVYKAIPYTYDSKGNPTEDFYTNSPTIFTEDFLNAPETPGDDITTFVYIYPEYKLTGYYSGGAKAYVTYSMAKIYDLKNKLKYEPVVAAISEPLEHVYTDGNVDRIEAPMNEIDELNFLRSLR